MDVENNPGAYVRRYRPSWFRSDEDTDWFQRAVGLCRDSTEAEQRAFAADLILTHVRRMYTQDGQSVEVCVQDGLDCSFETLDTTVDDFVFGVTDWDAYPVTSPTDRDVQVSVRAKTIDVAPLSDTVTGSDKTSETPETAPTAATQTFVDVVLNATVNIAPSGWSGQAVVQIAQHPVQTDDE